ncbi:MAG TPA: patatin-like phospholipase family protein [Ottowia sp.]|uniref:patatin-like phospholipase family protein n=1 Tax=Ottowia sp. TaxID=1898956 RepID=UPI002B9C4D61|nr:patatin-like phospholipase family protein [Ottowia sp.]HMN20379.1 patatin-like phospholipase family protein [Ottowia sp.]
MTSGPRIRSAAEQLQRDERAALLRRRRRLGLGNAAARALPTVGIALSGGGVRSATYALGLLRGLAEGRLLGRVDYLSSVSGGGFTAALFGRLVCALGLARAQDELADGGSRVLDWLRRNGRYLSPAGAHDLGTAAVSYLRAFLAIHLETLFALVPLALLVTLPHMLNDATRWLDPVAWSGWLSPWLALALAWLALTLPALLVGYWVAPETRATTPRRLYRGDLLLLVVLLLAAALATGRALVGPGLAASLRTAALAPPLFALALWSAAVGHAGSIWRLATTDEERPLAVGRLRNQLTRALRQALAVAVALLLAAVLDRASWRLLELLSARDDPSWLWGGLGLGGSVLVVLRALALPLQQLAGKALDDRAQALGARLLDIAGRLATLVLVLAWLVVVQWWVFGQAPLDWLRPLPAALRWLLLLAFALAWWLGTRGYAQAVNSSSLHSFYRARLVRAYLAPGNPARGLWSQFTPRDARLRSVTRVAGGDDVALAEHRPERTGGPIALINCCLNQTRDDASGLYNADRKGTLLTASARALEVGSAPLVCTGQQRAGGTDPCGAGTLGHWVAVSGAAAAPGAGNYTSTGWALVMFLLGIRLGHWMASPMWQPDSGSRWRAWQWRHAPKPRMLWSEASASFFGHAEPWWYASDGGHFDNTGVYPLIRRQCDFILLCDASADAGFDHADIENLVRKARIDFGAEIEFYSRAEAERLFGPPQGGLHILAPDDLADPAEGRGVLLARIRYRGRGADTREGTLLVAKPRLHDALDLDLLAYARRRPSFPHDATSDQFFDEAQWESYHRLGQDLGRTLTEAWLARLPGWNTASSHALAAPAALTRGRAARPAADAAATTPRWRRGGRAAVIGSSVGLGALGAVLLGLWQAQDQIRLSGAQQRQTIEQALMDVGRELRDVSESCPRVSAYTAAQVARLHELQGSRAFTPQHAQALDLLLREVAQVCRRATPATAACPGGPTRELLCSLVARPTSDADALSYWDPPRRPTDRLQDLWTRITGAPRDTRVAEAPRSSAAPPPPAPPAAVPSMAAAPTHAPAAGPGTPPQEPTSPRPPSAAAPLCQPEPAPACRGITIYPQIYDEAARERAESLRRALAAAQYQTAPLENVTRSAELRQQRRPVPWRQPTLIAHDAAARACAQQLSQALAQARCWPGVTQHPPWTTDLPASLKAQPNTLELWLPTPHQNRVAQP